MNNRLFYFFYLAPLVSGLLLVVSFPPFKLFVPGFLALVPLLYFIDRERSDLRAAVGAFFCGLVFWGGLLYWITLFSRAGYLVMIAVMSLGGVIFALAVRRLRSRFGIPVALSAPFVWTAIDYLLHAHGDLAFTWGQLAYTLTHYPVWLQMAAFTGAYGVTFWLVSINSLILVLLTRLVSREKSSTPARLRLPAVFLFIMLVFPPLLGLARYSEEKAEKEAAGRLNPGQVRVSYIQPAVPQEDRWRGEMRDSAFSLLDSLTLSESANAPDLVVWPEGAAPAHIRTDKYYQALAGESARKVGAWLLTGAPDYSHHKDRRGFDSYNAAFLFDPEGKITRNYNKIHLVPISERMPWEDIFTGLKEIDVGGSHFIPGERHVVFNAGPGRDFGLLICFESIFPELSRRLVLGGARFLVNITNDAWFERTSAAYQHSSFLVLRAIENSREVVRSANTGISAFYDRLGRRRQASVLDEVTAATGTVRTYDNLTFYTRWGDWPAHFSWTVTVLLLLLSLVPENFLPPRLSAGSNRYRTGSEENSISPKQSGS
ncbi:MAG: apolipoprotein N-acyltransferase [Gemmatimonadota bacterium]|nr:apolipoprotein N-acyltransferase [Gemmatimonadota bacterium]